MTDKNTQTLADKAKQEAEAKKAEQAKNSGGGEPVDKQRVNNEGDYQENMALKTATPEKAAASIEQQRVSTDTQNDKSGMIRQAQEADANAPAQPAEIVETPSGLDPRVAKELQDKAAAEAERIMNGDDGANTDDEYVGEKSAADIKRESAKESANKLRTIALDFQRSTPDEHVLFGRAGIVFTLGDLRALTNTAV